MNKIFQIIMIVAPATTLLFFYIVNQNNKIGYLNAAVTYKNNVATQFGCSR